jgi:hypothetical protein
MGIAVASPDTYTCPVDACGVNNGGCPKGHSCVTRESENGQSHVSCHRIKASGHQHVGSWKNTNHQNTPTCLGVENKAKCLDYHAIIQDQMERFAFADVQPDDNNQSISQMQQTTQTTPSSRTIMTSSSEIEGKSLFRTSTSIPDAISPAPNTTSSDVKVQQPTSTTTQKATTFTSMPTAQTPLSSTTAISTTQNGSIVSPNPPCQILPAPLQTTTTDASSNNDCKPPYTFKCYLSDKLICITNEKHCDGVHDCPNKEDENDCYISSRGQYNFKHENNWQRFVTVILIILGAAIAALFLVFGNRGRRRWLLCSYKGFSHSKMFEDDGTNIEISNPMFDEDDSVNLVNCPFSIDLNERTTNFSNPLYERQVLLVNDKNPAT